MADGRLQANPSAGTLIWWSNGSINSTLILACEDIELNQTQAMRTPCHKAGGSHDVERVIREKWKATGVVEQVLI